MFRSPIVVLPMLCILNNFGVDLASVRLISGTRGGGVAAGKSKETAVLKGSLSESWALSSDLGVLMPGE